MKREIIHVTGSGNKYPMTLNSVAINPGAVKILEGNKAEYCKDCPNDGRNGGCSWCAPDFEKLAKKYEHFHIITIKTTYDATLVYPKMALFHKMINVERLTANIINRVSNIYMKSTTKKSYLVSCGNCRSCRSKGCAVANGGKCAHPSNRRYSLEATGINVQETLRDQLCLQLLWYKKGSGILPDYLIRACGVLTNMSEKECEATLLSTLKECGYMT